MLVSELKYENIPISDYITRKSYKQKIKLIVEKLLSLRRDIDSVTAKIAFIDAIVDPTADDLKQRTILALMLTNNTAMFNKILASDIEDVIV